jgi:hypothetical protein
LFGHSTGCMLKKEGEEEAQMDETVVEEKK